MLKNTQALYSIWSTNIIFHKYLFVSITYFSNLCRLRRGFILLFVQISLFSGDELKSIWNEIVGEIKELYKLPLIAYTVDNIKIMYNQVCIYQVNVLHVMKVLLG